LEEINSLYNEVAEIVYKEKSSLLPGVKELILSCGKHGLDLAIASSSPLDWIQMVLKRFGLGNYFKVLCSTATMNVPGKPDPAIYNITMQKLGVTSNVTAVLEDSFVGVQSGIASGASVIAVPDNQWSFGDFSKADLVADSLEDKRIYQFLALI
jgi:HAD superfamily hydrolase (TIGR01509 family)